MPLIMKVSGLTIDPVTNSPIMILKSLDGDIVLPIWIGLLEAVAIAAELENVRFPRPMTHDLFKSVMDNVQVNIEKIEVCDLKDNTYFAQILFHVKDKDFFLDARPSDAVALALKTKSPIYVHEHVLEKSRRLTANPEALVNTEEGKQWADILEKLDPEDFSKYKM
ncbi:MAG: bifunctional nuclease family protein [Pseudomonadota bacterium]